MNNEYRKPEKKTSVIIPIIIIGIFLIFTILCIVVANNPFDQVVGTWYSVWVRNKEGIISYETLASRSGTSVENMRSTLEFKRDGSMYWCMN